MRRGSASVWIHEIPAELYTAILAARTHLREVLDPLRATIAAYRPRLKNFSLIGRFFGAFVLQNQLRSVFFRHDDSDPLAWVSGPGEPPQRWAGLMAGGQLVIDPERLSRARQAIAGDPWYDQVLHLEVSDDDLFEVCREQDWMHTAHGWFDQVWQRHQSPTRAALPVRAAAAEAFIAMLEHYRAATANEHFPLPGQD
jgi:hypothetical protein